MYCVKDIVELKKGVEGYKGSKINVSYNRGRQKMKDEQGVICETYPSVFTVVTVDGKDNIKTYSYVDVITKAIIITVLD